MKIDTDVCLGRLENLVMSNVMLTEFNLDLMAKYQQTFDYARLGRVNTSCSECPYYRTSDGNSLCTNQEFLRDYAFALNQEDLN